MTHLLLKYLKLIDFKCVFWICLIIESWCSTMFKSEITNKVLNIIFLLVLMAVLLSNDLNTTFSRVFVILVLSATILHDLYQIIKIKKQKAD